MISHHGTNKTAHRAASSNPLVRTPSSTAVSKATLAMTSDEEKSSPTGVDQFVENERPRSTDPVAMTMMKQSDLEVANAHRALSSSHLVRSASSTAVSTVMPDLEVANALVEMSSPEMSSPSVQLRLRHTMPLSVLNMAGKLLGGVDLLSTIEFIHLLTDRDMETIGKVEYNSKLKSWFSKLWVSKLWGPEQIQMDNVSTTLSNLTNCQEFMGELRSYLSYLYRRKYLDYLNPAKPTKVNGVRCTAWTGNYFAVAGLGGVVKVFVVDLKTRKRTLLRAYRERSTDGLFPPVVRSIKFMSNCEKVVYGLSSGRLIVWNLSSGLCEFTHEFPDAQVRSVSCHGEYVAVGTSKDDLTGELSVWNISTGKCMFEKPCDKRIMCVSFSRDGTRIASGGYDCSVTVWTVLRPAEKMVLIEEMVLKGKKPVRCVEFSPSGAQLVSGSNGCHALLWCLTLRKPLKEASHDYNVTSVAFSRCGQYFLSASLTRIVSTSVYESVAHGVDKECNMGFISTCVMETGANERDNAVKLVEYGYFLRGSLATSDARSLNFCRIPQLKDNKALATPAVQLVLHKYNGNVPVIKKTNGKKIEKKVATVAIATVAKPGKRKCVSSNRPEAKRVAISRRTLPPVPSGASEFSPIKE